MVISFPVLFIYITLLDMRDVEKLKELDYKLLHVHDKQDFRKHIHFATIFMKICLFIRKL